MKIETNFNNENQIILELKSKLFETEQKLKNIENLEKINKNLKEENLSLIKEKN